jgi:hypothetical protein
MKSDSHAVSNNARTHKVYIHGVRVSLARVAGANSCTSPRDSSEAVAEGKVIMTAYLAEVSVETLTSSLSLSPL